ncbi:MAG: hypothetical protein Q4D26_06815 [Clostridia bacterium]|nr:hypothetical protein [Clostridia bacterium]
MAEYKSVSCPSCGAVLTSRVRVDTSNIKHTKCPKCGKSLTVETGNGKARVR